MMDVDATLAIQEALRLAQSEHDDLLGFRENGAQYLTHRDDLDKMAAMGLGELPLACIAIPADSPLVQESRRELSATVDFSRRLSEFFPVYFVAALYELQSLILRYGAHAYVIGGITRDLLLHQEKRLTVHDVDITLEGDAIALAEFLVENSKNFKLLERFPEFGTAKLRYRDNLNFDLASTRQEVYPHCGALPVVVNRAVPLADDVIRRDFTVNALAFSLHELGKVLDCSNGIRDIEMRRIRVLHPVSFFEDPSRILRALKFCARFGFELAEETRHLLDQFMRYGAAHYKGGGERIKQELKSLFRAEESETKSRHMAFFLRSGSYRLINMESDFVPPEETITRMSESCQFLPAIQQELAPWCDRDFLFDVHLCMLCRDMDDETFQKTAHRLGLTKAEREFVEQFHKLKDSALVRFGGLHELSSPMEIYDLFNGLPFISVVASILELGFQDPAVMQKVLEAFSRYKRKWEKLQLELNGNDLISMGVPEGKEVGRLLDDLLHAKLAGRVPERMDEVEYIRRHLQGPAQTEEPHAAE